MQFQATASYSNLMKLSDRKWKTWYPENEHGVQWKISLLIFCIYIKCESLDVDQRRLKHINKCENSFSAEFLTVTLELPNFNKRWYFVES